MAATTAKFCELLGGCSRGFRVCVSQGQGLGFRVYKAVCLHFRAVDFVGFRGFRGLCLTGLN